MTEPKKPMPKRFIAGATCPACNAQDKIVMYRDNDISVYECVACGHTEKENFNKAAGSAKATNSVEEIKAEPLQFYPLPPKH